MRDDLAVEWSVFRRFLGASDSTGRVTGSLKETLSKGVHHASMRMRLTVYLAVLLATFP